jgi:transposase
MNDQAPTTLHPLAELARRGFDFEEDTLFYKTRKGAQMGDLFMSLIYTCELNDVNAFDYLTELLRHPEELKQHPVGMDGLELSRYAGATRCCVIE